VADFAVLVAVAIVETCLAHGALPIPTAKSIHPLGPNGILARRRASKFIAPSDVTGFSPSIRARLDGLFLAEKLNQIGIRSA